MADLQTPAFMLSSATLMLAPYGTDVFSLTPTLHSVGMVSDVAVAVESSTIELMNGVAQAVVDSRKSGSKTKITANVFEYTAQNLVTAMSLSSITPTPVKVGTLSVVAIPGATVIDMTSAGLPGSPSSQALVIGDIPVGSTLILQHPTITDLVFPTVTTAAATLSGGVFALTIGAPYAIPADMAFPVGTTVWVVNPMPVGTIQDLQFFCCKISGSLTNFNRPVTYVAPKVKIIKGMDLKFAEKAYSSMSWEIEPYLLANSEITGRLTEIGNQAPGRLYLGA